MKFVSWQIIDNPHAVAGHNNPCSTCIQHDVVDKEHAGHVVRKRSFKNVRLKLQNFSVDSLNRSVGIVHMFPSDTSDGNCRTINTKCQSSAFNTPSNEHRYDRTAQSAQQQTFLTTNTIQKNSDCCGASNNI